MISSFGERKSVLLWILDGPRALLVPPDIAGLEVWYDKHLAIRCVSGTNHACTVNTVFACSRPGGEPVAIVRRATGNIKVLPLVSESGSSDWPVVNVQHGNCSAENYLALHELFDKVTCLAAARVPLPKRVALQNEVKVGTRVLNIVSLQVIEQEEISIKGMTVECYPGMGDLIKRIDGICCGVVSRMSCDVIERFSTQPWGELIDVRAREIHDLPRQLMEVRE